MAAMTKTQLVRTLAEKLTLSNKQAAAFLEDLAEIAIAQAKKTGVFVLPGLGPFKESPAQGSHGPQPADR